MGGGMSMPREDTRMTPTRSAVAIDGQTLQCAVWGDGPIDTVMLHDGLGSIRQWRSVPEAVATQTGKAVLAYERAGHGSSLPIPNGPWPHDWLHREAVVFEQILQQFDAVDPFVVGHSDGGSIALIHAADRPGRSRGVLALAAHSWVEQLCFDSIVAMRADRDRIVAGLARSHDAPEAIFEAWSGVWVGDEFSTWDIRPLLSAVTVPTVIAQGLQDGYASDDHAVLTARAIGANAECRLIDGLGHIMHHDDADAVVDLIVETRARVDA